VRKLKESSRQIILVLEAQQLAERDAERDVPDYYEVDHTKMSAKIHPDSIAFGSALSGDDGTQSRDRVLFAVKPAE
jgi:hypothetical protein